MKAAAGLKFPPLSARHGNNPAPAAPRELSRAPPPAALARTCSRCSFSVVAILTRVASAVQDCVAAFFRNLYIETCFVTLFRRFGRPAVQIRRLCSPGRRYPPAAHPAVRPAPEKHNPMLIRMLRLDSRRSKPLVAPSPRQLSTLLTRRSGAAVEPAPSRAEGRRARSIRRLNRSARRATGFDDRSPGQLKLRIFLIRGRRSKAPRGKAFVT